MSGATTYFEIPGGELKVTHVADNNYEVGKRWEPSPDFTTVATALTVEDLLTVIIEHTISNTILWEASNPTPDKL